MFNSVTFAKAVADDTRQKIMQHLCCKWLTVSDLAEQMSVSQPTVSHHMSILKEAGLLIRRREGKQVFCTLDQNAVTECCGLLMANFAPDKQLLSVDSITVND